MPFSGVVGEWNAGKRRSPTTFNADNSLEPIYFFSNSDSRTFLARLMYQDNFTSAVYSDKFALVLTYSLTYIFALSYMEISCVLPAMHLVRKKI